jgi:membrane protein DedA with SNARE-associated domain/membrane-associated phospholipid phosphatase
VTGYLQDFINFTGLHPNLAIAAAFLVSAGEALPVIGLFSPSTVVLVGLGGLVGLGKASFWPVFVATVLGASIGDAISYWTGRIYKEHLVEIWPFSRHPGLLTAGERHFAHRGGMSIVIGRFIPGIKPMVSGVAGMMGMGVFRFTILNLLSAIAWAAVHILPGVSAGLALAGLNAISKRLAIVIGVLVIAIVLAIWLTKIAIGSGLRHLTRLQMQLLGWARRRGDRIGSAIERLVGPDHADFRLLVTLNMILIGALVGLAGLLTVAQDAGGQFGSGFVEFLQSLRTSWADNAMVGVTMLGDWLVTSLLGIVGCVALLIHRRSRLAIGLLLVLVSSVIFVQGLQLTVHPQSSGFSIPTGDATMAATLYGAIGWIAVRGGGANLGRAVAGACVSVIIAVAFSRLYLAAQPPSDVAAGLLFGTGATATLALVFRGEVVPRRATKALIAACAAALAIVGGWHVESGFHQALALYAPQPEPAVALSQPWRDGGWKALPAYRVDLTGETEEPLLLQWHGSATALENELTKQGWLAGPAWSLAALNALVRSDTGAASMPVIPKFDDGRLQTLAMIRAGELAGEQGRFVLRAWSRDASEPNGSIAEILLGSIFFERVEHPLSQLSIPIGADHRTCDGDQLLSNLTNALRVGESLAGPAGSCGGQIVLAW